MNTQFKPVNEYRVNSTFCLMAEDVDNLAVIAGWNGRCPNQHLVSVCRTKDDDDRYTVRVTVRQMIIDMRVAVYGAGAERMVRVLAQKHVAGSAGLTDGRADRREGGMTRDVFEVTYAHDRRKHRHRCRCCGKIIDAGERVVMARVGRRTTWAVHLACANQPHSSEYTWREVFVVWTNARRAL